MNKKPSFEESIDLIDKEIYKRKNKWHLTALSWFGFDDMAQILRIHIYKKWDSYDHKQPLPPWINKVISNQIINMRRNLYGNFARPCLKCAAAEGDNLCKLYEKQCNGCPLYAYWEKNRKHAYDIKLPLSTENHMDEVISIQHDSTNIDATQLNISAFLKQHLKPVEYKVYQLLYIEHRSDTEIAKQMGYRTTEKGRNPGYKQIKYVKNLIIEKTKKALYDGLIDIVND